MASGLWASRVASSLRISVFRKGYRALSEDYVAARLRKDLKYACTHGWVKVEGNAATVGVAYWGLSFLSWPLDFVVLPEVGDSVTQGGSLADFQGFSSTSVFCSPVSGKVIEVNERLESDPQLLVEGIYDEGWMVKVEMSEPGEVNKLMDVEQYRFYRESRLAPEEEDSPTEEDSPSEED